MPCAPVDLTPWMDLERHRVALLNKNSRHVLHAWVATFLWATLQGSRRRCWGVGCRGEPMSAMRRSHALAVQREGAQRIELRGSRELEIDQGSGGNGRGVGSGQWVGSGPRKGYS